MNKWYGDEVKCFEDLLSFEVVKIYITREINILEMTWVWLMDPSSVVSHFPYLRFLIFSSPSSRVKGQRMSQLYSLSKPSEVIC